MNKAIKKIIVVGPAFPYRGGPARFNENMCKAFIEQNIEAEIVSFTLQYPSLLFPGSSQFEASFSKKFTFKITRLINTINPLSWIKTAKYINQSKPDLVIFRYWLPFFAPAFGTIAKLLKRSITILALTDNVIPHEKRIGDHSFTRYFFRHCDGFIGMSEKVLNDLNTFTHNPNKALVHHPLYENYPPPIDQLHAREILGLPKEEKIILFFGLIRPYKGLDILLEAISRDELKGKAFKILIAGEFYENKKKYFEIIEKHRIQNKIILKTFFIPDDEVNLYFSACDTIIQPYKSATNSGVSMMSYFYEKPIISTNVGGLKEIIKEEQTGWLCNPDPESIAKTILKFLNTTNLEEMRQNIHLFKKEFSWNSFVKKIIDLFIQINTNETL